MSPTKLCRCRCTKCVQTRHGYTRQTETNRYKHQIRDQTEGPYIPPCPVDTCVLLRGRCLQVMGGRGMKDVMFQCSHVKPASTKKHPGLDNYIHAHFERKQDAAQFYHYYHTKQYTLCSSLKDIAVPEESNSEKVWYQMDYDSSVWDNQATGTACPHNTTTIMPARSAQPIVLPAESSTSPSPTTSDDVGTPPTVTTEPTTASPMHDDEYTITNYYNTLIQKRDQIQEKIDALTPFIELVAREQTN